MNQTTDAYFISPVSRNHSGDQQPLGQPEGGKDEQKPFERPTEVLTAAVQRVLEWHLRRAVRH